MQGKLDEVQFAVVLALLAGIDEAIKASTAPGGEIPSELEEVHRLATGARQVMLGIEVQQYPGRVRYDGD